MFEVNPARQAGRVRSIVRCDQECPERPARWPLDRLPVCNRPRGHDGVHTEFRAVDAKVLAAWSPDGATILSFRRR